MENASRASLVAGVCELGTLLSHCGLGSFWPGSLSQLLGQAEPLIPHSPPLL